MKNVLIFLFVLHAKIGFGQTFSAAPAAAIRI